MRKGKNLSKENLISISESNHRVIIPLYIPNEDTYYKDAYKIFEYCLFSVIKTSSTKLKVSVISNNSSDEVNGRLFQLQKQGYIEEIAGLILQTIGNQQKIENANKSNELITKERLDYVINQKKVIGVYKNIMICE